MRREDLADSIVNDLISHAWDARTAGLLGDLLAFLSPDNRERVLARSLGVGPWPGVAASLKGLSRGVRYLDAAQRERFVDGVVGIGFEPSLAIGLEAVGEQMSCLGEAGCERLIQALGRLRGRFLADALSGLGRGMASMSGRALTEATTLAIRLEHDVDRAYALAGLAIGMSGLERASTDPDCERVLGAAVTLRDDEARSIALAAFGVAMARLGASQRSRVIDAVAGPREDASAAGIVDECARSVALAGLATGLASLTPPERGRLLDAASGLRGEEHRTRALIGLATGLADVAGSADADCERLIAMAGRLRSECFRAEALEGLGRLMWRLGDSRREHLIDLAVGIGNSWNRSIALGGLGMGMAMVSEGSDKPTWEQCERLLAAAVDLSGREARAVALAGLARSTVHLSERQRDRLIDAIVEVKGENFIVRALRGLGLGMACMNDAQCDRVVDVALGMRDARMRMAALEALAPAMANLTEGRAERLVAAARVLAHDEDRMRVLVTLAVGRGAAR